jgi:hypothetical protein
MLVGEQAPPEVLSTIGATLCWLGDAPLDLRRK